ncbi:hypothetical protein [Bacillus sp. JJ722]
MNKLNETLIELDKRIKKESEAKAGLNVIDEFIDMITEKEIAFKIY